MKKILLGIIIIIILAIIIIGGVFTYQYFIKPNPTAGWKTYTNTQYEFELKYPNNWIAEESEISKQAKEEAKLALWIVMGPADKTYYAEGTAISPVIISVRNESMEKHIDERPSYCVKKKNSVVTNGTSFIEIEESCVWYSHDFYLNLSKDNQESFLVLSSSFKELDNIVGQILSTFKFTK